MVGAIIKKTMLRKLLFILTLATIVMASYAVFKPQPTLVAAISCQPVEVYDGETPPPGAKASQDLCEMLGIPTLTSCTEICRDTNQGVCQCPRNCANTGLAQNGSLCGVAECNAAANQNSDACNRTPGCAWSINPDRCVTGTVCTSSTVFTPDQKKPNMTQCLHPQDGIRYECKGPQFTLDVNNQCIQAVSYSICFLNTTESTCSNAPGSARCSWNSSTNKCSVTNCDALTSEESCLSAQLQAKCAWNSARKRCFAGAYQNCALFTDETQCDAARQTDKCYWFPSDNECRRLGEVPEDRLDLPICRGSVFSASTNVTGSIDCLQTEDHRPTGRVIKMCPEGLSRVGSRCVNLATSACAINGRTYGVGATFCEPGKEEVYRCELEGSVPKIGIETCWSNGEVCHEARCERYSDLCDPREGVGLGQCIADTVCGSREPGSNPNLSALQITCNSLADFSPCKYSSECASGRCGIPIVNGIPTTTENNPQCVPDSSSSQVTDTCDPDHSCGYFFKHGTQRCTREAFGGGGTEVQYCCPDNFNYKDNGCEYKEIYVREQALENIIEMSSQPNAWDMLLDSEFYGNATLVVVPAMGETSVACWDHGELTLTGECVQSYGQTVLTTTGQVAAIYGVVQFARVAVTQLTVGTISDDVVINLSDEVVGATLNPGDELVALANEASASRVVTAGGQVNTALNTGNAIGSGLSLTGDVADVDELANIGQVLMVMNITGINGIEASVQEVANQVAMQQLSEGGQ